MDSGLMGKFIAELRKEKKMTQAELGEKVGVTNKTVSRWENGNYMPDISLLPALANELGVSINELISGRRIEGEEFKKNADDNLMVSYQEIKKLKRQKNIIDFLTGAGTGIIIGCLFAPESVRKSVMIAIGIMFFAAGGLLKLRYDNIIFEKLGKC